MGRESTRDDGSSDPAVTKTATTPPQRLESPSPELPPGLAETLPAEGRTPGTISSRGPLLKLEPASEGPAGTEIPELPPAILERYEIVSLLGSGGMGAVYRARDSRLQREVALKILFRQGPESTPRMLREARSQARLDHE